MPSFKEQIRSFYSSQSLSQKKVGKILEDSRAVAGQGSSVPGSRVSRKIWRAYLAAAALLFIGFVIFWQYISKENLTSYALLPPRLIEFFQTKSPVVKAPADKKDLREWLVSKGAPADFEMPASLTNLENAACQVLNINGKNAYLSCYWRQSASKEDPHNLVHLLISRTADFRDLPPSKPVTRQMEDWSFVSWKKGGVAYTLAAQTSTEKLMLFLSQLSVDPAPNLCFRDVPKHCLTGERLFQDQCKCGLPIFSKLYNSTSIARFSPTK